MQDVTARAIEAFRENEKAELLAEQKSKALLLAIERMSVTAGIEDAILYREATIEIIAEFEVRRMRASL